MPDPTLLTAMEEIKAILLKHDIAANVILSSRTHMEYLRQLQTSWNALSVEPHGDGFAVRFRCKRADYPTREAWQEALRLSVGTLAGFKDALEADTTAMKELLIMCGESMQIDHVSRDEGPRPRF